MDAAYLGSPDAEKVLVIGPGTYGIEGFPGSVVQTHWLNRYNAVPLPRDSTHAHNPWGFANALRFTEENVDLNRNFIDFDEPMPATPFYEQVQRIICRPDWRAEGSLSIFDELAILRSKIGEQAFSDAFSGGQYSHADGIFYGGVRERWSDRTFRLAVSEHASGAKAAAIVDLHAGIGPRYRHIFLCFRPENSVAYERARAWWGVRAINGEGVTHKAVAKYQGLLVDAFASILSGADTTTIVVEFGTVPRERRQGTSMAARWLMSSQAGDPVLRSGPLRDIRQNYYPSDPAWRAAVPQRSGTIIDAALHALSHG